MSRKSVVNVENAHNIPRLETVHSLAHGLGVPLSELIEPLCARHGGQVAHTRHPLAHEAGRER